MGQPYPRIIVLHLAVLGAFALVLSGAGGSDPWLTTLTGVLPTGWRDDGVVAVALLLVVKTAVDVITTRRALRRR